MAVALALALHRGRCDLARLLVAAGAPLGAPALGCRTLLHAAAAALDEAAVAFLLALGLPGPADPRPLRRSARGKLRRDRHHLWINEPDARGRSPLDLAAARLAHDPAAHAIVAAMLRCGCESASGPAGRLFAAIGIGDMDCVARVCGSVDINQAKNWIGDRPVHAAVRLGSIAIVQALVAAGADVDAASANGWTDWADPDRDRCRHQPPRDTPGSPAPDRRGLALVLAVERRNRPMVDLLLASGAVPASYPPGAQARLLDMSMDGDFHHRSDFRIDQFRLLLDLGCRPDPHGPLLFNAAFAVQHHARSARQYDDGLALLARLRDLGAATAPPAGAVPRPFQRALHRCALRLSRPMLQFLLSLGVDEAVMRPP
nr:hypothetical protein HK105_004044 [Polyrhizophydium stewartii]